MTTARLSPWRLQGIASASEGSRLACVLKQVQGGTPLQTAMTECAFAQEFIALGETGRDVNTLMGLGGGASAPVVGIPDCSGGGVDPRLGAPDGGWSFSSNPRPQAPPPSPDADMSAWPGYQPLAEDAQRAWKAFYDRHLEVAALPESEWPKYFDELNRLLKDANDAINKRDAWRPSVTETDPQASDICRDLALFIMKCNTNGWSSPDCEEAMWKMRNCSDPAITDPHPDGDDLVCPNGEPTVDPAEVERVASIVCSMRIKPSPGENPCEAAAIPGTIMRGYLPRDDATPCGDPRALTGEEQCSPSVTVVQFGKKDVQDIADEIRNKYGGPSIIIPIPQPGPIGPGPK